MSRTSAQVKRLKNKIEGFQEQLRNFKLQETALTPDNFEPVYKNFCNQLPSLQQQVFELHLGTRTLSAQLRDLSRGYINMCITFCDAYPDSKISPKTLILLIC